MTVSSPGLWQRKWLKVTSSTLFKAPCTRLQLGCHTAGCPSLVRGLVAHMLPACKWLKNPAIFLLFLPFNHVNSFGVVNSTWVTSKVSVQKPRTGKWRIVKGRTAKSWCSVSLVQLDNSNKSDDPHNAAHWPHWSTDWQTLPFLIRSRKAWQCLMGWLPSSFWLTTIRKQCRNHSAKLKHAQTMRINQIYIFPFQSQFQYREACLAQSTTKCVCTFDFLSSIHIYSNATGAIEVPEERVCFENWCFVDMWYASLIFSMYKAWRKVGWC